MSFVSHSPKQKSKTNNNDINSINNINKYDSNGNPITNVNNTNSQPNDSAIQQQQTVDDEIDTNNNNSSINTDHQPDITQLMKQMKLMQVQLGSQSAILKTQTSKITSMEVEANKALSKIATVQSEANRAYSELSEYRTENAQLKQQLNSLQNNINNNSANTNQSNNNNINNDRNNINKRHQQRKGSSDSENGDNNDNGQSSVSTSSQSQPTIIKTEHEFIKHHNHHAKAKAPSEYSNERENTIDIWLFEINEYLELTNCDNDKKIRLAATYLKAEAKEWYRNKQINNKFNDWNDFTIQIKKRFQSANIEKQRLIDFDNIKQLNSVAAYINIFQRYATELSNKYSEEMLIFKFIKNLNNEVGKAMDLIQDQFTSLDDAYAKALNFESSAKLRSNNNQYNHKRNDSNHSNNNNYSESTTKSNNYNNRSNSNNSNTNNNNNKSNPIRINNTESYNSCDSDDESTVRSAFLYDYTNSDDTVAFSEQQAGIYLNATHLQRKYDLSDDDFLKLMKERKCFNCRTGSHLSKDCPSNKYNNNQELNFIQVNNSNNNNHIDNQTTFSNNKYHIRIASTEASSITNSLSNKSNQPYNHDTIIMKVNYNGIRAIALIDTGATHTFVNQRFINRNNILTSSINNDVQLANGTNDKINEIVKDAVIKVQGKEVTINTLVLKSMNKKYDIVIGIDYIQQSKLSLDELLLDRKVKFNNNDTIINDNIELNQLTINSNKINQPIHQNSKISIRKPKYTIRILSSISSNNINNSIRSPLYTIRIINSINNSNNISVNNDNNIINNIQTSIRVNNCINNIRRSPNTSALKSTLHQQSTFNSISHQRSTYHQS